MKEISKIEDIDLVRLIAFLHDVKEKDEHFQRQKNLIHKIMK